MLLYGMIYVYINCPIYQYDGKIDVTTLSVYREAFFLHAQNNLLKYRTN